MKTYRQAWSFLGHREACWNFLGPSEAYCSLQFRLKLVLDFFCPCGGVYFCFFFDLFGDLMGLPMLEEPVVGGYHDMVRALRTQLNKVLDEKNPLRVLVVGHGGRDTMCCMPVIEAVARDDQLRKVVHVHICTSSWPHDEWEEHLERYIDQIERTGMIEQHCVCVHSMKIHHEHNLVCAKLHKHLD